MIIRSKLWRQALAFYENSELCSRKLRYTLIIEFNGEEGVDGGVLRHEFFDCLLSEVNSRLFEGNDRCRLPKTDWNGENSFRTA